MPRKVRELKAELAREGFILLPKRGKGSHSMWHHPLLKDLITIAGKDGADADRYQEKDVRKALKALEEARKEDNNEPSL